MRSIATTALLALTLAAGIATAAPKSSPAGILDTDHAIKVWKSKPGATETTAAMRLRVRKELAGLLSRDPKKLDADAGFWKLLAYLRDFPWDRMPANWKKWYLEKMPNPRLTEAQRSELLETLKRKPIYQMTPKEVDVYLGYAQTAYPDLRQRVVHIARKMLNQPYDMYLLGEFPYEIHDPQPLFDLTHGDCVVFSEHVYSMSLSRDWTQFFRTLLRIRYKDGQVGMTTRNHYTEADWDRNNAWLVRDVTTEIGATTVSKYSEVIDRAAFFAKFGIGAEFKPQRFEDSYIPAGAVESVLGQLRDGDFVNVVRGQGWGAYVGHVGLVGIGPDGKPNFIHSTPPRSKEQPVMEYVRDNVKKNVERAKKGQPQFLGLKFLRLRAEDLARDGVPPAKVN